MNTYIVKDAEDDTILLRMDAVSKSEKPTSFDKDEDPIGLVGFAEDLVKELNASVEAIASRCGSYSVLELEKGEEPDGFADLLAAARKRNKVSKKAELDLMADGSIAKMDKAQQNVFGWAYVTHLQDGSVNIDKSGDFIDAVEEIEKSAYDFVVHSRNSDADHTNVKGGTMIESMVFTPEKIEKMGLTPGSVPLGWWIGFHIEDDATWERVEKGELTAFSIHGSGTRSKVEPSA